MRYDDRLFSKLSPNSLFIFPQLPQNRKSCRMMPDIEGVGILPTGMRFSVAVVTR